MMNMAFTSLLFIYIFYFNNSFYLEKVIKKALQEMLQFIHLHSRRAII